MDVSSNLDLFLNFIKGDSRCSQSLKQEQRLKGIPIGSLDFPLYRYVFSLRSRLDMITFLRIKIPELNTASIESIKKIEENGSGSTQVSVELILLYEAYLNQIYNVFENIAKINLFIFNYQSKPPHSFHKQMKKIKSGNLTFDQDYDRIISEKMIWYEEIDGIRGNSNHFLVGLNVYARDETKNYIPMYMNYNISDRENRLETTIERNILDDTIKYYESLLQSLELIAGVYLKYIEKDNLCHIPFRTEDQLIIRELSLNQYIEGNLGKIVATFPLSRENK
jgi:hypothetical protein